MNKPPATSPTPCLRKFGTHELLNPEECRNVRDTLVVLRQAWIRRHPTAPFFTLGASNYFDIAENPDLPYYRLAKQYNPVLLEHFDWLYQRVASTFANILRAPVAYRETLARPGFHIFLGDQAFTTTRNLTHKEWFRYRDAPQFVGNPIHCDTPQWVVDWGSSAAFAQFDRALSFTLAIELPAAGAGMNVWDLRLDETNGMDDADLRRELDRHGCEYCAYQPGQMVYHSGMYYHQVAPMQEPQPDDMRITLQGHGLCVGGIWQLYW